MSKERRRAESISSEHYKRADGHIIDRQAKPFGDGISTQRLSNSTKRKNARELKNNNKNKKVTIKIKNSKSTRPVSNLHRFRSVNINEHGDVSPEAADHLIRKPN